VTILAEKLRDWLMVNRSSARLGFLLRVISMALSSIMGLLWTPLFLDVLGTSVYGTFLSFQATTRLGAVGDLGLTSGVALRTGQMLGRGEFDQLRPFLASARTALLLSGALVGGGFCVLSPWLPRWLAFENVPAAGSLTVLFIVGGITITANLWVAYFNGINMAFANITWPVLPALILTQVALLAQWFAAKAGLALWGQAVMPLLGLVLQGFLLWWLLRVAHPWLGEVFPLRRDTVVWRSLLGTSIWVYLYALGSIVFTTTDRLLVNAGFGPAAVPPYQFNYKLCEMAIQVISSASFVALSKINPWIANPAEESQARSREAVQRLLLFDSLAGTVVALGYIAINNQFVRLWVGSEFQMPAMLQWAFALTLVVTMGGNAGIQVAGVCGRAGLRTAGIAIGVGALVNLALSFVAMKMGSLLGIAFATVFAQTGVSIFLARYTSRQLRMSTGRWLVRAWLLPVGAVLALAALHSWTGSDKWTSIVCLLGVGAALVLLQARLAGVDRAFVFHEMDLMRKILTGQTKG
jgi:O-antigen/teichoic acid export membrane protein